MFTQCPQCDAAFRITAEVLQQARGQVRCGSCNHAFNALDHLSEEPPAVVSPPSNAPDVDADTDDNRSQALLKTLDRLAGPDDIRIEDTGVEWLVVDEDDAATEADSRPRDPEATGSMRWILEGSEDDVADDSAVPEVSDPIATDGDLETAETSEQLVLDEQAVLEYAAQSDEPRYDDNTPLPDDFEEQHSFTPPDVPDDAPQDASQAHSTDQQADEPEAALELSEPDEWTDLLDEVAAAPSVDVGVTPETATEPETDDRLSKAGDLPLDVEEELAAIHGELSSMPAAGSQSAADALPLDDDDLDLSLDDETAPAMGPESEAAVVASQLDDLLEAMGTNKFRASGGVTEAPADNGDIELSDEVLSLVEETIVEEAMDETADAGEQKDTAEAPAETDDIELSDEVLSLVEETIVEEAADEAAAADETAATGEQTDNEAVPAEAGAIDDEAATDDAESQTEEPPADVETADAADPDGDAVVYEETTGEFERAIAKAEGAIRAELAETGNEGAPLETEASGDGVDEIQGSLGPGINDQSGETDEDVAADGERKSDPENDVPERSSAGTGDDDDLDDEIAAMTGNLKIDANLLRAMKDEDLAAAMVDEDGSPIVETIVMEGDFVRGAVELDTDEGSRAEEKAAPLDVQDPGSLVDTYMFNRNEDGRGGPFSGKRAVVGIIVLILLLIGQFVHNSRESLATFGAFNQTLAPLYRMFGNPVTPTWDIKGWQFEATNGSTSEDNSLLTIYSRISNRAQQQLPYPLVHVSLTDRYEEIVGSRVLEPNEYLAGDVDPSRPVAAGDNFTAVITVASPSPEATGFKLNVCYRVTPGRVRCAIEDFKAP